MADLAPWGQRTAQWTDGWLVLASEQKKRAVPRQGCPRFINSLCVWYVAFLSLQLLTQRAHPASPSTGQQADNPIRHKGLLQQASTYHIWVIMMISQLTRGVSCLGYVCHELMAQTVIHSSSSYSLGEWYHPHKARNLNSDKGGGHQDNSLQSKKSPHNKWLSLITSE